MARGSVVSLDCVGLDGCSTGTKGVVSNSTVGCLTSNCSVNVGSSCCGVASAGACMTCSSRGSECVSSTFAGGVFRTCLKEVGFLESLDWPRHFRQRYSSHRLANPAPRCPWPNRFHVRHLQSAEGPEERLDPPLVSAILCLSYSGAALMTLPGIATKSLPRTAPKMMPGPRHCARRCLPGAPFPVPRLRTATSSPKLKIISTVLVADPEPNRSPDCH